MSSITHKMTFSVFLLVLIVFSPACQPKEEAEEQELTLEGSWNLTKYIPQGGQEGEWQYYGDSILYQKHLSPDHFAWFKFDTKNDKLLGMGGGSYVIKDGKYIENIEYFYPPGSSELGQAIPFTYELEGDNWYHLGHAKEMGINTETGQMEMVDSSKIDEIWEHTNLEENSNSTLVGTWDLVSYRDSLEGEYTEYPDFVGYMKLITPTHFTWIYYDSDGDEIYAAGSGTYEFNGEEYAETLKMLWPDNAGTIGSTIKFQASINDNSWQHYGYLPVISIDDSNGKLVRDSLLIDERWTLHEPEVMDGITF